MQITLEGKTLDQIAIERIREYEPPEGYYLGFSGGKDSVVIYDLAVRSGVKFDAHYNVSPIDPPEIRDFIKVNYPDITWDYNARGFFKRVLTEGMPMRPTSQHRWSRWCCKYIKEVGGVGKIKLLGMRRDESNTRKEYLVYKEFDLTTHTFWFLPIVDWSSQDVWAYIYERSLKVCSLYKEGFKRLGCVLCPMLTANQTKKQIIRFPKIAQCWRLASDRYFDKRIERGTPLSMNSKDEFWEWWISRK